jgi:hypothetical protein
VPIRKGFLTAQTKLLPQKQQPDHWRRRTAGGIASEIEIEKKN